VHVFFIIKEKESIERVKNNFLITKIISFSELFCQQGFVLEYCIVNGSRIFVIDNSVDYKK